ncbi:hypothetical protein [Phocoenobacter skyensis]|uniref:Uncharacterized protein n=1 Tax=Phocoenobacter skyensis TaxID=97481 RepID=A0A1H7XNT7_9PAST|nr:hypothetical protein [Pasteurella skyensis]MDP8184362.1 hypothetical protein [Pasteurella skyensis]QLB22630.1 hypothetical protein A6B44_05180 [Pasteurella skyensis]SEM34649.1 hypothetical protein SAMN05444853_11331 [Pasteurella skyensis]
MATNFIEETKRAIADAEEQAGQKLTIKEWSFAWCYNFSYCKDNHVYGTGLPDFNRLPNDVIYYDSGYGVNFWDLEHTFIVFDDGTWLSRREYDGAEWWEYNKPPSVADFKGEKK